MIQNVDHWVSYGSYRFSCLWSFWCKIYVCQVQADMAAILLHLSTSDNSEDLEEVWIDGKRNELRSVARFFWAMVVKCF